MGLAFPYRVKWNFSCIIEAHLVGPNNYRMLPLVVAPFVGSGTTQLACLKLGRRFIGVKIDAGTLERAWQRITEKSVVEGSFPKTRIRLKDKEKDSACG